MAFKEALDLIKNTTYYEKYKWHDLRKDPNDLPSFDELGASEELLVFTGERYHLCYYSLDRKWHGGYGLLVINNVIAWCEIPTFKEEQNG